MDNWYNLYPIVMDELSSSSSSSSSSSDSDSDEGFWDPILYPTYRSLPNPVQPQSQQPPQPPQPVPLGPPGPPGPPEPSPSQTYDFTNIFRTYNETMTFLVDRINTAARIYNGLGNIGGNDDLAIPAVPGIRTRIPDHKPVILDNYIFPVNEKSLKIVEQMKSNIEKYSGAYDSIYKLKNEFNSFKEEYQKLNNN